MDRSASLPATRWRTATIVASAVAAFELALLLAIGTAVLGRSIAHHVEEAAVNTVAGPRPAKVESGGPTLARSETGVLVLNGNGVAGAAAEAAATMHRRGYVVAATANAKAPSPRTLVMYRPGFRAEARRLARDAHAALVTPLDGVRPDELLGAQLVLVLGR